MDIQTPNTKHNQSNDGSSHQTSSTAGKRLHRFLVILNISMLALGSIGGPLILRLYFRQGGTREWLSSCLQTAGWPFLLLPLSYSFFQRRWRNEKQLFLLTPKLFIAFTVVGLFIGVDDYLYAYGLNFLPVSTSSLLISTQLAFTAVFAFFIVKQRFTGYSINAIALLTVGAALLGIHANGDRPEGVNKAEYYKGFALTLAAAALYGLILPVVEVTYSKLAGGRRTYAMVVEAQTVMGFFATVVCVVGMIITKDFQAIPNEARNYGLGEERYYLVLVCNCIIWQFFFLGAVGVIFTVNTLLAGVLLAVFMPITEVFAVFFFKEKFSSGKAFALVLALWGLASYSFGEYKDFKKKQKEAAANPVNGTEPA